MLEPPTPAWFRDSVADLHYLLAARDFGPVPVPLSVAGERLPFGASFAVRLAEQQRFPFDPDLGVAPGRRRGGEETSVAQAILESGSSGWWVPGAEVQHIIAPDRQTTAYIAQFYRSMGEAWARTTKASSVPTRIKVVAGILRFSAARTTGSRAWVRYLASLSFHRGALAWFQEHRH